METEFENSVSSVNQMNAILYHYEQNIKSNFTQEK